MIATGVYERPRYGPRPDQWWSGPVGGGWPTAKTGFLGAEPTPSRFPADRQGDQDVVGSHLVTTFLSLRLRVAQLGGRDMISVPAGLSDPMFDGSLNAISRSKAQGFVACRSLAKGVLRQGCS
jgi:hypothetical protein